MLQESFAQYVFDNMSEMVLCFDDRGDICYANKSAEHFLEYGDVFQETHISEIFPNEFIMTDDGFQTNIALGNDTVHELMAYRMNRTCFAAEVKISSMNEDFEYVCLMKDVSNVKYLEKRMKKVKKDAEDALKVKSDRKSVV